MTIEEKEKIMANVKNFCAENSGNRLSPKWLVPGLIGSTGAICDECIKNTKNIIPGKRETK